MADVSRLKWTSHATPAVASEKSSATTTTGKSMDMREDHGDEAAGESEKEEAGAVVENGAGAVVENGAGGVDEKAARAMAEKVAGAANKADAATARTINKHRTPPA